MEASALYFEPQSEVGLKKNQADIHQFNAFWCTNLIKMQQSPKLLLTQQFKGKASASVVKVGETPQFDAEYGRC